MKPVLLGMNNPLSPLSRHALYPYPPRCSGWRLWKMLEGRTGATKGDYLRTFERRNILSTPVWNGRDAADAAPVIWHEMQGRRVVVLGQAVARALDLDTEPVFWQESEGVSYTFLPHPSGRNLWYNDDLNRACAAILLEELYIGYRVLLSGDEEQAAR